MRHYNPSSMTAFVRSIGLAAVLFGLSTAALRAQLSVSPSANAADMAAAISGPGVTISNPTINCHVEGYGEFTYSGALLGLDQGVILTTGKRDLALGPNNSGSAAFNASRPGSPLLNIVTGRTTFDQCKLEFDVIPAGDTLKFNFAFGSEEYNEWVGTQFNDVFGFFISGPGITGDPGIGADHNIALIPNTSQPVAINSVNNGTNSQYFYDNTGGSQTQYDGFTQGLAAVSAVQPCQTYHLKLIIADATDNDYDSGVLIEKVQSNPVTIEGFTNSGGPDLIEGCNNGFVRFTRSTVNNQALTLQYFLQGTATNGVDYQTIGNPNPAVVKTITIPANQAFVDRQITTLVNIPAEPTETMVFILGNPNCPAMALDTVTMSIVDTLAATLAPTPPGICLGGSMQFQVNGGEYYSWSPAAGLNATNIANPVASPTTTTIYECVVTDDMGCSRTLRRMVRVSNMALSATVLDPLCNGGTNGAINLTVTGGIPPFSYSWTGPGGITASTQDLTNRPAGTYTVTVSDAVCTLSQSYNIGQPSALGVSLSALTLAFGQNITCYGSNSGSINATISGGTAPYTVAWTGPSGYTSTNVDISNLYAGTYTVTVTDAQGCTATASLTLTQASALSASIVSWTNVTCRGAANGTALATPSGGVAPYTYSWNTVPVQTVQNATNLGPGTYTVTVTDAYGCTATASRTITQPAAVLSSNLVSTTNVNCLGASTGSATVSASGGTAPYTFSWNTVPAQTTATANGLPAGIWTCTITDARGCTTTRAVTITQPGSGITTSIVSQTNVLCRNASTGAATVNASGGTPPYSYSWNTAPVQTTATATNLPAGVWSCTVTDQGGCTAVRIVTITQPAQVLSGFITSVTNILCFGDLTGGATASGSGGVPPYSYSWNTVPVTNSASFSNKAAGTYTCTITDANGCVTTVQAVVTQPADLVGTITAQGNVLCNGQNTGSATVGASGGVGGYSYTWNTVPPQTTSTASNIPYGVYTATVTDLNGCTTTAQVTITQPASPLTASAVVTPATCGGPNTGAVNATVSGGTGPYTYSWTAPGGFTASTEDISGLAAGVYTLYAVDANNCDHTSTWNVNQPGLFTITSVLSNYNGYNVACRNGSNGSIDVTVTGAMPPYTYSWTGPGGFTATTQDVTGRPAGQYVFTVTDAGGCSNAASFTLTQPSAVFSTLSAANNGNGFNITCFGGSNGSINSAPGGGIAPYTYAWSGPGGFTSSAQNVSGRPTGTYTLTTTDNNGCPAVSAITLTQPVQLTTNILVNNHVLCRNGSTGSATAGVSGGVGAYTFNWNTLPATTTATASGLAAGSYTCTVTDANGCTAQANVTITQPATVLSVSLAAQTNVLCTGAATGSATVSASGATPPYSYTWNTVPVQSGPTATGLSAGTYNCTVVDANGCNFVRTVTITQPTWAVSGYIGAQTNVSCFGGNDGTASVVVSGGTGAITTVWNTIPPQNGITANNLAAGYYTYTSTDQNGCTYTGGTTISQPSGGLSASITASTNVACNGGSTGSATTTATGGSAPYSFSWNTVPVQTAATASNLPAGAYTCTVTDANGCTTNASITITQPAALTATAVGVTNVTCFGANNGTANIIASGGTAPYTYQWSFGSTTASVVSLMPGNYSCIVRDANNCAVTVNITVTQPAAAILVNASVQTASCLGVGTGAVNATVTGGTPPYTYAWSDGNGFTAATQDISGLNAGAYTVVVTDANGCTNTTTWTVTDPGTFTINTQQSVAANGLSLLCPGDNNAWITTEVRGGQQPYSYSWTGPNGFTASTDDISGLSVGTYVFTVTDAIGCISSVTFNITQPAVFASTLTGVNVGGGFNISCIGGANGSISGSITGGNAPLSYAWNGPGGFSSNSANPSGLVAGTYNVTVTDARGCTFTTSVTLTQPPALSASAGATAHVLCRNAATGSASASAVGGVAPYVYSWNTAPVQTGPAANNLAAGTWTVTVTDANGCSTTANITITQPATVVSAALSTSAHVSCFGANNGTASASASGGTAPYTYSWNTAPVQTAATANNLAPGTYTCTVTDANGCTASVNATITQPAAPLSATIGSQVNVLCFGNSTGSATASASGGTAPYAYVWNTIPIQNGASATNLPAGSYTCTVSDANGCTAQASVTIAQPSAPLAANLSLLVNVGCHGGTTGSASVNVGGGTPGYTFTWNTVPVQTTSAATGLAAGNYTCTIVDANGCSTTANATIGQPAAALSAGISAQTNVLCFGNNTGTATASVGGGTAPYSYAWNTVPVQTSATAFGLAAGNYTCTVTDANNCTTTTGVTITQPAAALGASVTAQTNVDCYGNATGSATVTAMGGTAPYSHSWNTVPAVSGSTANNLPAGTWTCTVTDANGCTFAVNVTITQPAAALTASISAQTNVLCFGDATGSATALGANGTSPYAYSWNTIPAQNTAVATGLSAGSYACTVTDANGCTATVNATISQPAAAIGVTAVVTPAACQGANNGAVNATVIGGTGLYMYAWSGPSGFSATTQDISSIAAGVYTLVVTDANGCAHSSTWNVNQPGLFTVGSVVSTYAGGVNVSCVGASDGSIDMTVNGATPPYTYSWTGPNGFTANTIDITGLEAGNYVFTVTDANGCATSASFTLNEPVPFAIGLTAADMGNGYEVSCNGGSNGTVNATVVGGTVPLTYAWSGPNGFSASTEDINSLPAGSYTLLITDANGCTATNSVVLTQPSILAANSSLTQAVQCFAGSDGFADATATGGVAPYSFAWNSVPAQNNAALVNVPAGTYTCTVTDDNGCTSTTSVTITQPAAPLNASITAQTAALCFGSNDGTATANATGGTAPYSYSWNTMPAQSTALATGLSAGTHTCTVTDANGCTSSVDVIIAQPAAAVSLSISAQQNVSCFGGNDGEVTVAAAGGTAPYTYVWNTAPAQTGATASALPIGTYHVTVTDANGCSTGIDAIITGPSAPLGAGVASLTHQSCFGVLDGQASVIAGGGTAPYTYSWNTNPVQTGSTAVGLDAGLYTVVVTDQLGCVTQLDLTINGPTAPLTLALTSETDVLCHGENTGAATVDGSGGTAPYTYEWSTSPQTFAASVSNQPAGTYTALVTDANGCTASVNVTIDQPIAAITVFVDDLQDVGCHSGNDGYATVDVSGGSGNYSVIWNTVPQQTGNSATGLAAGTYAVQVTDNNGCATPTTHNVTISGPAAPLGVSVVANTFGGGFNTSCELSNDGGINATATGGTAPYDFVWTDAFGANINSEDIANLAPGSYDLLVTDANGCTTSGSVSLQAPSAITASGTVQTAACQGSPTGWITSNPAGGVAPYTLSWSGPNGFSASTVDIFNLTAGVYVLTIVDANGCSNSIPFDVNEPGLFNVSASLSTYIGGDNVSCNASSDGSINVTVAGATAPYTYSWTGPNGFSSSTEDITGLESGTYDLTVTDANGCSTLESYTLSAPAPLNIALSAQTMQGDNLSCNGGSDGAIDATVVGGTPAYNYGWTGPNGFVATTQDINALAAGTYTITATDANGCMANNTVTLVEPDPLDASATTTVQANGDNISCNGANDGNIDLTLNGGHGPYTVLWSGPNGFSSTAEDLSNLAPGNYNALITDISGCTTTVSITLTEPTALNLTSSVGSYIGGNAISCNGMADGSIDLTVAGGAGSTTYQWTGSNAFVSTAEDLSGLAAGTYQVVVTDQNGCTVAASFTLTEPQPIAATASITTAACQGANNGAIDLTATGGMQPYSYFWSGPAAFSSSNEDITSLFAGVYTVTITDANGCSFNESFDVNQPGLFNITATVSSYAGGYNVSCAGLTDGSIDATVSGGTPAYFYFWTGPNGFTAITQDINGLAAGTYALTLTDQNGCSSLATYTLVEPTQINIGLVVGAFVGGANTSCNDTPDGSIDATIAGGETPYTIAWSGPNGFASIAEDLTGLEAGTYTIDVTDLIGCSASATIVLDEPDPVVTSVTAAVLNGGNSTSCNGANDGSIELTIQGGAVPYLVAWSGPNGYGSNDEDIDNLAAGSYTAVVTDANGCTSTSTIDLTAPDALSIDLEASLYSGGYNLPCSGSSVGTINATVIGGLPGFTYAWSGPNGFTSSAANLIGVAAGDYTLVATDVNGCTGSMTITLVEPDVIDTDLLISSTGTGYEVSCLGNDGSIGLDVTGGTQPYQFDWFSTNGFAAQTEDLSALMAGDYTLTLTDDNGCTVIETVSLTAPDPINATLTVSGNLCAGANDGMIDLQATGGAGVLSYAWTGPNGFTATTEDVGPLPAGIYTVTINDIGNCTATLSDTIDAAFPIDMSVYVSQYGGVNISCVGDSTGVIDVQLAGGRDPLTVAWTGPNGFTSNATYLAQLPAGSYALTVTDGNGCTIDTTVTLTEPASALTSGLLAGTYPSGTNVSCFGASDGSIDATVSGGTAPYTYDWRGPDSTFYSTEDIAGAPAGQYYLVVTDTLQCAIAVDIVLTQPDSLIANASVLSDFNGFGTPCDGSTNGEISTVLAGGNGANVLSWTGPNGFTSSDSTLTGLGSGTYYLSVTDMNGCIALDSASITAPLPIDQTLTPAVFASGSNTSCPGVDDGSITAITSGGVPGYQFAWTGPNGFTSTDADLSGLEAGTYCLTVTDSNACSNTVCADIVANTAMATATATTTANCGASTGSVDLTVTGGGAPYTFDWDNGASTEDINNVLAGTYTVTITDVNGCSVMDSAAVIGSPTLSADAVLNEVLCSGGDNGSIDLTVLSGTAPYDYDWSNGSGDEDIDALSAGDYTITVTDAMGCTWNNTYTVSENAPLEADTTVTVQGNGFNVSTYGGSDGSIALVMSGGTAPYGYAWSNGATTATVDGLTAGSYTVTITDANGCELTLAFVLDQPNTLLMPTGFSPNGDGENDAYVVQGLDGFGSNRMLVVNRWGNTVFDQLNYKNDWRGENQQGEPLPNGTYFVIIIIGEGDQTLQNYVDLRR